MDPAFQADLARFGPNQLYPTPTLRDARNYCAALTRRHYENFTVISLLLPRKLIPHFQAVYAYCRWADDLADETSGGAEALQLLNWWREQLRSCYRGETRHPVLVALRETIQRFAIPPEPFLDLIDAFEQDQRIKRYPTFERVLDYCRRSANPVGRLVLYLGESFDAENARLSDFICTGLQLANFWQDVARDYRDLNRVYLPQEDLLRFGISEADLQLDRCTEPFRQLMRFQVARAAQYFEAGRPLIKRLPRRLRVDIELFCLGGVAILHKIEQQNFDVLSGRPKLGKGEKIRLMLRALLAVY